MVKLNTRALRIAMSKPRKKQGNPDFRHRVTSPAPTSEEIESRLIELLTPGTFANLKDVKDQDRNLRARVLQNNFPHSKFVIYIAVVGKSKMHFY